MMETLAFIAFVALAGLAFWRARRAVTKNRSLQLQERFQSEYERELSAKGRRRAERALKAREQRVANYPLHALNEAQYDRFSEEWIQLQSRFVDDPAGATIRADHLVTDLMLARGYPMHEFDQRAEDLSVTHPRVVQAYREAREVAVLAERGEASTESLRQALVQYRALFDELLVLSRGPIAPGNERTDLPWAAHSH